MSASHPTGRLLSQLIAALGTEARSNGPGDPIVHGLSHDSRTVVPGTLFVALPGARAHGATFAADAVARGAVAILTPSDGPLDIRGVPIVAVPDVLRALSRLASLWYGDPSRDLAVVGITGTNGKTTTSDLVRAILDEAQRPCARIGTLGVAFGAESRPLANTTPLALELQGLLAEMRAANARAVVMEVSSHALAQNRVADVRFACGALTNVTRDHLDYHGTMEAYAAAKRGLFDLADRAVLDLDDPYGATWARELRDAGKPVTTCALDRDADVRGERIELATDGSTFEAAGVAVRIALPGRFNVRNALLALAIGRALGVDLETGARGIGRVRSVPGRMEAFSEHGLGVFVDYAHTPDALANVLRTAREIARGAVIAVFGCGGDRDAGKRPEMGRIAADLADRIFVTSDNSRGEDPQSIAQAILSGVPAGADVVCELDRRTAIRRAIASARAGDVVVVAGKGHEGTQTSAGVARPFDDRAEVRAALASRAAVRA